MTRLQNRNFFIIFIFTVLLSLLLSSCGSSRLAVPAEDYEEIPKEFYIPEKIQWEKLNNFTDYFFYENRKFPVRYHCLKINLDYENLKITAFPDEETDFFSIKDSPEVFFKGKRASKFSRDSKSQIVLNTSPFAGKSGRWDMTAHLTATRKVVGVHIADRKKISQEIPQYSAVSFSKTATGYAAAMVKSQEKELFDESDYAFGGFFTILENGVKNHFSWVSHDSRTAVGTTEDGKTLFVLIVEAENWAKSHGLSYPECADVFIKLGASDAIQLDGGGSSSLYINGKNKLSYPVYRINAAFMGFSEK